MTFPAFRNAVALAGLFLIFALSSRGQNLLRDSVMNAAIIQFHYTMQFPGGELAERFGRNSNIGGGWLFKLNHNVLLGFSGRFLFGNQVREDDLLDELTTADGLLINQDGFLSEYMLLERGFQLELQAGKVIPVIGPNPNCGLGLLLGGGFLQHKVKIDVQTERVPQLEGDYLKGYDRLTNGLYLSQFIGYFHLDTRKLLNFYIGAELQQGFTENRRAWDYDRNSREADTRHDLFYGIKLGWMIPIYRQNTQEFFYY